MLSKIKKLFNFMYEEDESEDTGPMFEHKELHDDLVSLLKNKNLKRIVLDETAMTYLMVVRSFDINVLAYEGYGECTLTPVSMSVGTYFGKHSDRVYTHLACIRDRLYRSEYKGYQLEDIRTIIDMFNFYIEDYNLN